MSNYAYYVDSYYSDNYKAHNVGCGNLFWKLEDAVDHVGEMFKDMLESENYSLDSFNELNMSKNLIILIDDKPDENLENLDEAIEKDHDKRFYICNSPEYALWIEKKPIK